MCAVTDGNTPSNGGSKGSQDPIESYGASKQGDDDMDVDVEEGKFDQSHPMQTALNRDFAEKKSSREKVAAVASPQKRKPSFSISDNSSSIFQFIGMTMNGGLNSLLKKRIDPSDPSIFRSRSRRIGASLLFVFSAVTWNLRG